MIFQHHRFQVWNANQHPYKHALSDFQYANPALPTGNVTNLQQAMDWLFAVLYPQTQTAVATPAALPLLGNTINDYRVVLDDGDGKAASYRWEQREGEASPSWHKIYDMDWGEDSILSAFLLKTQDVFVYRHGYDDIDSSGNPIAGIYAGQTIFGGASASTNLTLFANSGDGTGPNTGYIQMGDNVRPTTNETLSLGTAANKFFKVWTKEANIGTMTVVGGLITDTSGNIDFDDETLETDGSIRSGTLTIGSGSITDTSGAISFGDENLTTTGAITGGQVNADNLRLDGNTLSSTDVNGNIIVLPNGTGIVDVQKAMTTLGITATGVVSVTGQLNADNLRLDANTLSSTNVNGNITIDPNGTGIVQIVGPLTALNADFSGAVTINGFDLQVDSGVTGYAIRADDVSIEDNRIGIDTANTDLILAANGTGSITVEATIRPNADNALDLGTAIARWEDLYLSGTINDGTNDIDMATVMSLRDINVGVAAGMTIFWNGTKWVASAPDTEVDHGTITGLLDDDHTQYLLLAGRAGGQTVYGDTASGGNLTLNSTSHATQGAIIVGSTVRPGTDLTRDLGSGSFRFNDAYIGGQLVGARLQNATTAGAPAASAGTVGRLYYNTDEKDVFVDIGGTWRKINAEKYVLNDTTNWDGVATSVVYTVSADVSDARNCIWMMKDNANNYEQLGWTITATATQVTVTTVVPPPAGNYTLIGLG